MYAQYVARGLREITKAAMKYMAKTQDVKGLITFKSTNDKLFSVF